MKKNFIFYTLCFITILFFISSLFTVFKKEFRTQNFSPVFNMMSVTLEVKQAKEDDFLLKVNDDYYIFGNSKNTLNKKINYEAKDIRILVKEGLEDKVKSIVIFNDIKPYYFKDFSSFEKETKSFCSGYCLNYSEYKVPNIIKYNKNSTSYNFHSVQNTICVLFLSLFSGKFVFIISYLLFFITVIYFINNKEKIKYIKINNYVWASVIFLFGILIYSNGILDYLPWGDEYATIEYSNPKNSFMKVFLDPGNPPLFYILFRFFVQIFGISLLTMKIFPFIIGILFSFLLWVFLKNRFNLKIANLGLLLAFINVPLIYFASEARSYILQALMTIFLVYYLFKIFEQNKIKDYIIYGVLVALVSNIHYYEILLLCSNFLYAVIYFLIKKRYFDILKFFLANLIGGMFFLPFFVMTAFNKALVDTNFNAWIPDINIFQIERCIYYLFGGIFSFIISSFVFAKNIFQKDKDNLLIYSYFAIMFTIFLAVILSYSIRPMLVERYLVLLIPLFLIFLCSVFAKNYKNKYIVIFFIIWVLLIQGGSFEKNNKRKGMIEVPNAIAKQYYEQNGNKKHIYSIINLFFLQHIKGEKKIALNEINYISKSEAVIEDEIKKILNEDKNAIIFTSMLKPNKKNRNLPNNYTCFFNGATDLCLWKIEN